MSFVMILLNFEIRKIQLFLNERKICKRLKNLVIGSRGPSHNELYLDSQAGFAS